MKTPIIILIILVASSFTSNLGEVFIANNGTIAFSSDAPLELIQAKSKRLKGAINTSQNTFAFAVLMSSFQGFNSALQREHFNENYMETHKFPKATFKGKILETINYSKNGTHRITAKGTLSMHGVKKERTIKSTLKIEKGKLYITSDFKVPLSDHNIAIPKIVTRKIATEIKVKLNAEFIKR